jgi:anaerobic magnesium-protoporphyrin IX monomethyl ester cyclase
MKNDKKNSQLLINPFSCCSDIVRHSPVQYNNFPIIGKMGHAEEQCINRIANKKTKGLALSIRVLLIGSPKTIIGFDRVTKLPNLGLNSIAANIQNKTIDVKVLDLVLAKKQPIQYLLHYLKFYNPDIVGFSCMTFQYDDTIKLARLVKEYKREIIVIIGGYHPTVEFENLFDGSLKQNIDFIIRNEGEITFNLLIEQIQSNKNYQDIPSLSYVDSGRIFHNPQGNILDLDHVKIPDRENRVLKKGFHILGNPADVIETSRGCVNHCKFCSIRQMYHTTFRKYKIERVIEDIRDARHRGAQAILIVDDNITADVIRFESLCKEIMDNKLNDSKYAVQASIPDLIRAPNLPKLMSEAGVHICFLGIENIRDRNIDFLNTKQIQHTEIQDIINELQGYGITVIGSFIIGNPEDTREIIYDNFHYANNINVDIPLFLILTPFPKTEIREELLNSGLITNVYDYSRYDLFHANVKTHSLSSHDLDKIRDEIAFKIFKKNNRFWKLLKKYPNFSIKLFFDQLINQPKEVLGYMKGIIR